jgi:hypothetical protein
VPNPLGQVIYLPSYGVEFYYPYTYWTYYEARTALRFSVDVPKGAYISSASITFYSAYSLSGAVTMNIWAEDNAEPSSLSPTRDNLSNRVKTSAYSRWTPASWVAGYAYASSSLTDVVSAIVSKPDWGRGNDIIFLIEREVMASNGYSDSFLPNRVPDLASYPPYLTVIYDNPTTSLLR